MDFLQDMSFWGIIGVTGGAILLAGVLWTIIVDRL